MKLTWLGHACFMLEQDGYKIVIDPYSGVQGYPPLRAAAHMVLCSHGHFDHDAVDCVECLPEQENPFTIRTVETCHDEQNGALRGSNLIHVFTAGGMTVAHLGDLGHQLTAEQLAQIGPVNGVLTPVGGVYTVDAAGAGQVCDALHPDWIVPMHYCHAPYGLPELSGVEEFLAQYPQVERLTGAAFEPDAGTSGVIVPAFA